MTPRCVVVPRCPPTSAPILRHLAGTLQLTASTKEAAGKVLSGRTIGWSSSDASIAPVSETGLVVGMSFGGATITATSEGVSGPASVTVRMSFESVSSGRDHTCGVTPGGEAHCRGAGEWGQLGDGSPQERWEPTMVWDA